MSLLSFRLFTPYSHVLQAASSLQGCLQTAIYHEEGGAGICARVAVVVLKCTSALRLYGPLAIR